MAGSCVRKVFVGGAALIVSCYFESFGDPIIEERRRLARIRRNRDSLDEDLKRWAAC